MVTGIGDIQKVTDDHHALRVIEHGGCFNAIQHASGAAAEYPAYLALMIGLEHTVVAAVCNIQAIARRQHLAWKAQHRLWFGFQTHGHG